MSEIKKAYAITDAKISFVSLVDKAANKKGFLITKANEGERGFLSVGKIIKADNEIHYITGIVYEPMVEDTDSNYMTAEEIQKAAYWFAKNGDKVDLQHDFEACSSCVVVENWVAKSDFTLGEEEVKKGTWLISVEVTDNALWESVEKGDITGFSMGGVGKYSTQDMELQPIEKEGAMEDKEKKGILKQLASVLGLDVVEKGILSTKYEERVRDSNFWDAVNTLTGILSWTHYDYNTDRYIYKFEEDETSIKEVLEDFSGIITSILLEKDVAKALIETAPTAPILKVGKKMSKKNKNQLEEIMESLSAFKKEFEEEEVDVKKEEFETAVATAVAKALASSQQELEAKEEVEVTKEMVETMVGEAVRKALQPKEPQEQSVEMIVAQAVEKAIAPILKQAGLPTNLNHEDSNIKKTEGHYLTGVL